MKLQIDLTMPTEEVVGKAINVLVDAIDGKRVSAAKVTAAAALLTAYGNLRPLESTRRVQPAELLERPKISPPPGVPRMFT